MNKSTRQREEQADIEDDFLGIVLPTLTEEQLQEQAQQRSVGSLVLLTQKFVKLMKDNNGQIDLKEATELLDFKKRRIYDITNVLEGIGLIEKTRHSSIVRWRGVDFDTEQERSSLQQALEHTNHLIALEADLDIQLDYARRNLRYIKEDEINKSYAYVTRDDLVTAFGDDIILTIPNHDKEVQIFQTDHDLHVSLDNGSTIDIRLVTNQGESTTRRPDKLRVKNFARLEGGSSNEDSLANDVMTITTTDSPAKRRHQRKSLADGNSIEATITNHLVEEHTYFCNPISVQQKEEMEELERELTAKILFQNTATEQSLRRFYPDDPDLENPPLVQLNPPQRDYNFVLTQDEGVCEMFDIPITNS